MPAWAELGNHYMSVLLQLSCFLKLLSFPNAVIPSACFEMFISIMLELDGGWLLEYVLPPVIGGHSVCTGKENAYHKNRSSN